MSKLKFSIVTVCRNAETAIEKTIRSVVQQTYGNIEYIVIDGVSTDNTLSIVNQYSNKIAVIKSEPDKGIYDAMNKGIALATGDYVYFLNAGDTLISDFCIEKINELITSNPAGIDIFFSNLLVFDERNLWGYIYDFDFVSDVTMFLDNIHHQASFTRLALLKQRPFDISYRIAADYEWFVYGHAQKKYRYKHANIIVAVYDPYGLSGNPTQLNKRLMERVDVLRKNYPKQRLLVLLLYNYLRVIRKPAAKRKYIFNLLNQLRVNLFGI